VVVLPLLPPVDPRSLDTPERPRRRVLTGGHARARLLHIVGERVQDADDDHAVRARVEAAVHGRGDVVAAVPHAGVRKDDDTAGRERRGEVPLAPTVEELQRPCLAELLVLAAVELVDLLLQSFAVELHRACAGRSA
jgi:hypothetical protein